MGLKGAIRAVGWLESPHPFRRGPVDPELFQRLMGLIERPLGRLWCGGLYWCTHCAAEGKVGPDPVSSQCILLVPALNCVYETPIWIGHYVHAHSYLPPDEFCHAVRSCPGPGSDAYRSALIAYLPELSSSEMGHFPFFDAWEAQQTLRPCPEDGSEENFIAARQDFSENPVAYMRYRWRRLTRRWSGP
jgi:hypothetical protein